MRFKHKSVIAAAVLYAAGCAASPEHQAGGEPAGEPVQVQTFLVQSVSRPARFEATGTVKARLNATLSSKVMSRVASVLAREGDEVRSGQLLIALDGRELQAGVQVARANLHASSTGVDAARTAREMESRTSEARIAQAEAAVLQSRAALSAAQSKLDLVLAGPRVQERTQARLAVVQAESSLQLAKTQLDRVSRLVAEGAMARRSLEEAQNAYDLALAQRDTAIQAEKIAQEGSRAEEIQAARDGVAQAQAALKQAEANVRQARAAALQTRVRADEIRSAQAQVAQTSANLRSAQVSLSYTSVSAPFAGRVVRRDVDPGSMALPGVPLLTLEGGDLRLEVLLPESVLTHVRKGSQMPIRIDATAQDLQGVVDEIVPQGDASSHTFLVKLVLPQSAGIRSGMFGRAFVPTGTTHKIVVPASAVWEREGLRYVYVVNAESLARLRIVTQGPAENGDVEILSGLSPGDRIVVEGRGRIRDGMKVVSR